MKVWRGGVLIFHFGCGRGTTKRKEEDTEKEGSGKRGIKKEYERDFCCFGAKLIEGFLFVYVFPVWYGSRCRWFWGNSDSGSEDLKKHNIIKRGVMEDMSCVESELFMFFGRC